MRTWSQTADFEITAPGLRPLAVLGFRRLRLGAESRTKDRPVSAGRKGLFVWREAGNLYHVSGGDTGQAPASR